MNVEHPLTRADAATTTNKSHAWTGTVISANRLLAVIIVVAVLLRLVAALYQGNTVVDLPGIYDQLSYHGLAQRVVEGHGFSFAEGHWPATRAGEPTAHWSYLYTLYLSAVYALFGVQPLIARLIQAVIVGILQPWLVYRLGKRVFGVPVGILAAAFTAMYIYFFYYAGGLLTESFYFVGILWTLDTAMQIADQGRRTRRLSLWIELGLAIGVTVLLRQVFLLFVPFLFGWLWWNLSEVPQSGRMLFVRFLRLSSLKGIVVAVAIVVLLIAPWTVRNYRAFGTFVLLNTNAGFALFWGNHPIHGTDFMPLLPIDGPSYQDLIPPELLSLNEGELDRTLFVEAVRIIVHDPIRYGMLSLSRSKEFFKFWPSNDSGALSNVSRLASFGVLLPFIIYGLWLSVHRLRSPQHVGQSAQVVLLYLFITAYTGLHLMTWTLIRYRLPVDVVLVVFAAYGCTVLARRTGWLGDIVGRDQSQGGKQ